MRATKARAVLVVLMMVGLAGCAAAGSASEAPTASETPVSPTLSATPTSTPGTVAPPPVGAAVDYQLGGAYEPAADVRVVTRDRTVAPDPDRYSICYVNAFQTQPEEAAGWRHDHPERLLHHDGTLVQDPDWQGEYLFDLSTPARRAKLITIVGGWIDGCARDGFRAVEPDNLDSWTRSHGSLSRTDNEAFAALLTERAHRAGLAVAQKNTAELAARRHELGFDFAVAEECQVYAECSVYEQAYGDHVIEIEYTDEPVRFFDDACHDRGGHWSILRRDRDVVPRGHSSYRYDHC